MIEDALLASAAAVKTASFAVALASTEVKNHALTAVAQLIRDHEREILRANAEDCRNASPRIEIDRLRLTSDRIAAMAHDVEAIAALPDPIGEEFDRVERPNGLIVSKRRVPLGVVGVVYESRPNVTTDIAALCLKTGNGVLLRGGSEAVESNTILVAAIRAGLHRAGLPESCVGMVGTGGRVEVERMLKLREFLDVIIPRGGAGLIKTRTFP